jgi:hypothetical protein
MSALIVPPAHAAKPLDAPLSGLIVIIKVQDDGIKIIPSIPNNPQSDIFALKFNVSYRIDLDLKKIEYGNRQQVKPFISRDKKKKGFFASFKKDKAIQTSTLVIFVNEQYDKQSNVAHYQFSEKLSQSNKIPKIKGTSDLYIEARTNQNKKASMGGNPFGLALKLIKGKAGLIKSSLMSEAKQMGKEVAKEEIQNKLHGGKFPDIIGDAQKLVKFTMNLPVNGYKVIKTKGKALLKAIKGGDIKKAQKYCDDISNECDKKGGKCGSNHKGGNKKGQCGGNKCSCKGKCHCGGNKGQCGGAKFNIHSKANQEFGKALNKKFKDGANKIKKQQQKNKKEMDVIRKFKSNIKALPLKSFGNLKSKTQAQSKKDMIKKQDKKLLAKKQANLKLSKDIKKLENEVYGMFR